MELKGECKTNWQIICEIATAMGCEMSHKNTEDHNGTPYLYEGNKFSTPNDKGQLFACNWRPPKEPPVEEYPLRLSTVGEIGHYSAIGECCRNMSFKYQ